jgi:hypothetical protein
MSRRCGCHSHNGFVLSPEGLAQQFSLEGLAPRGADDYVDREGSVSALVEVEEDSIYDENHTELNQRLIHNGS